MSRKKKKGYKNDLTPLEIIILVTAILQLVNAILEIADKLI